MQSYICINYYSTAKEVANLLKEKQHPYKWEFKVLYSNIKRKTNRETSKGKAIMITNFGLLTVLSSIE